MPQRIDDVRHLQRSLREVTRADAASPIAQRRRLKVVAGVGQRGHQIATLGKRFGWAAVAQFNASRAVAEQNPTFDPFDLGGAWITAVMLKGPIGTLHAGLVMVLVLGR